MTLPKGLSLPSLSLSLSLRTKRELLPPRGEREREGGGMGREGGEGTGGEERRGEETPPNKE